LKEFDICGEALKSFREKIIVHHDLAGSQRPFQQAEKAKDNRWGKTKDDDTMVFIIRLRGQKI
jgi:hypothetical protein